jgi:hypothetical protein
MDKQSLAEPCHWHYGTRIEMPRLPNRLLSTISIALGLLIPAISAHADQCMLIPKQQALAAMTRLEPGETIYSLCELCGEKQPQPIVIKTIELVNDPGTKLWQVKINDRGIDLAYTYVRSNDLNDRQPKSIAPTNSQINLSILAKCPATGFTPILSIK